MNHHAALFSSFSIGDLVLPNRIVMAPMVRARAIQESHTPGPLLELYYVKRANAGLIVAEACAVSEQGLNCYRSTGIYTPEQVWAWRRLTDRIHEAGGRIFLQLLHAGRASHVSNQPGGATPVSPSAVPANTKTLTANGFVPVSPPRELERSEIPGVIESFRAGARRAREAGFDGVEIHAANGYLLDQFMKDGVNRRTDDFGGPIENRIRLTLGVLDAVKTEWEAARVGLRISPGPAQDAADSNPSALFGHLIDEVDRRGAGYVHMVEGTASGSRESADVDYSMLRRRFRGTWIANNGYTAKSAAAAIESRCADLISFGRPFVANPDLVQRFRCGAPLNEVDKSALFGGGREGLLDYPTMYGIGLTNGEI